MQEYVTVFFCQVGLWGMSDGVTRNVSSIRSLGQSLVFIVRAAASSSVTELDSESCKRFFKVRARVVAITPKSSVASLC